MAAIAGSPTTTPQGTAVMRAPSIKKAENLWEKALEALDKEERANIDFNNTDKLDILQDILTVTEEKQRMCLAKRWTYRKGNKEIIIRDKLEKIVRWVDKFKQIGDQVVQYDPSHAALPWAGVRFFLQLAVNDSQMFGAIAEGMEFVSNLITRYVIFEKLYQRTPGEPAAELEPKEQLSEALCKLYATILRYLSKAKRYYTRNTAERFLKAAKAGEPNMDRYISNISKAKIDVDECAQLIDMAQRQTIIKNTQELRGYLIQLDDPINRSATLLSDIQDSLQESERRAMFKWLSRTQYANHHKTMGKDFLPDSGNWLLRRKEFVEWRMQSSSSILWLHGIPGSGKSKLIYLVIEHLNKTRRENTNPAPMAYFYCVRNPAEPERADPDEIMRSILKQLSSSTSAISVREPVATRYKELKKEATESGCEDPPKLTVSECEELILELLISNPATIVIDALDECNPARRHELLQALDNIIQVSSNVVNIFVSSRDDNDIVCQLENSSNVIIKSSDNCEDIQRYIISQVDRLIKNKRLLSGKVSEELKKQIISVLTKGAQGMFRWVSLQLQTICDPQRMKHEGDIVAELGKLPKTLNESYKAVFEEIRNAGATSQRITDGAMKWLLCSMRRLTASELIAAVSNVDGKYISLDQRALLDICCNLLVLDEELETFRFAHLSVREYLETCENFNKLETNALVVQRCVDMYIFEQQDQSELAIKQNNALKPYAACYWPYHCQDLGSDPGDKTKTKVKQFLIQNFDVAPSLERWTSDAKKLILSSGLHPSSKLHQLEKIFSSPSSPLIFACYFGLNWIMHDLNGLKNVQWNQKNTDLGSSGLSLAAKLGYETVVRSLVQRNDVDVNLQNWLGQTALSLAAANGHEMIVQMLLERDDVGVNLQNWFGQTALSLAAANGHEMIVQMLLERDDVDVNLQNEHDETALYLAVRLKHEMMVQMLLERDDVGVNLQNRLGETALYLAVKLKHEIIVQMLLERDDVDVNHQDRVGETALYLAVKLKHEMIVRMLLERDDVDVNLKNNDGKSSLSLSAESGHETMMQMLLERNDVVADSKDENGQTPLSKAAREGKKTVMRLLLERDDVCVDFKDDYGRSPLSLSAESGHETVVQMLLERNDVAADSKDKNDQTPLSWAAYYGHEAVVQMLLERDDVAADSKDKYGQTPLSWASYSGNESVVRLLLERDDVTADSKDNYGQTPLSWAAREGEEMVVRLLLERDDVTADSKDNYGRTPLSLAAYYGHEMVMQMLLERDDVAVDSVDRFGRTPRDLAAAKGYPEVVELFDMKEKKSF